MIYNYIIGPYLSFYNDDDGLYDFDNNKDGQAFFFLENVNMTFPKLPNDNNDNNNNDNGLLTYSTDTA